MSVDYKALHTKQAGFASGVAKFLTKGVPGAFKAINTGASAIGLGAKNLPYATAAAGAIIGGVRGASKSEEGKKNTGALKGALMGGAIGYGGGSVLSSLPTLGKYTSPYLENAGKTLSSALEKNPNISAKDLVVKGNSYIAKNFSNKWTAAPAGDVGMSPMFGKTKPVEEVAVGGKKSGIISGLGELAGTVEAWRKDGIVKGTGKQMWHNIQESRKFTKDIQLKSGTETVGRAHRSIAGQVVGVGLMSGAGMGASEMARSKDEHGNVRPMGQRIVKGTGTALAWGLASPVMIGKSMLDLPKTLKGGNKLPPQENNI